jgi:dihydrofolate synthase/folylpolyglutamate synthase
MLCLHDLLNQTCLLHYKAIDLGLGRCLALLEKLGNPHLHIPPAFHVAGTNGKGSTLAFIKQILQDNGHTVHRYTSPHLVRFNERIELCGVPATEDVLAEGLAEVLRVNDGASITTFEAITCLSFLLFARYPADFTLLEVGVGGRLDATNVIQQPLVTGITSISLDHQSDLGETVERIAFEKAGIIKSGVPVVVPADLSVSICSVIESLAQERGAPFIIAPSASGHYLGLPGDHQRSNAGLAIQMIESVGIKCVNIEESLQKVEWPGRLQRLALPQGGLWLDGAHNEAGSEALASSLTQLDARRWIFFIHIKARKDARAMLRHFAPIACYFYFVDFPVEGGEGMALTELFSISEELGVKSLVLPTMSAFMDIVSDAHEPMIVTGSLFFVGKILDCFN